MAELRRAIEHEKVEGAGAADVAAADVSAMALRLNTAEDALADAQAAKLAAAKQIAALEGTVADLEAQRTESETAHENVIQRIEQAHVDEVGSLVAEHDQAKVSSNRHDPGSAGRLPGVVRMAAYRDPPTDGRPPRSTRSINRQLKLA